jgi:hypothetical protein
VAASYCESTWSRSTSALVSPTGTVAPLASVCFEFPGVSWRYLRPIVAFNLIFQSELTGSGSMLLLRARFSTAIGCPFAVRDGTMLVT